MFDIGLKPLSGGNTGGGILGVDWQGAEAGGDAKDISIDDGDWFVVAYGGDGGGGIRANSGEFGPCLGVLGELIGVGNDFSGGVEISGAGVVSESLPKFQNPVDGGGCEVIDGREFVDKALKVVDHRFDACLLEHDFANPDAIRRGGNAPRERAADRGEPREKIMFERWHKKHKGEGNV